MCITYLAEGFTEYYPDLPISFDTGLGYYEDMVDAGLGGLLKSLEN